MNRYVLRRFTRNYKDAYVYKFFSSSGNNKTNHIQPLLQYFLIHFQIRQSEVTTSCGHLLQIEPHTKGTNRSSSQWDELGTVQSSGVNDFSFSHCKHSVVVTDSSFQRVKFSFVHPIYLLLLRSSRPSIDQVTTLHTHFYPWNLIHSVNIQSKSLHWGQSTAHNSTMPQTSQPAHHQVLH